MRNFERGDEASENCIKQYGLLHSSLLWVLQENRRGQGHGRRRNSASRSSVAGSRAEEHPQNLLAGFGE